MAIRDKGVGMGSSKEGAGEGNEMKESRPLL